MKHRRASRGVALLLAMIILALVATAVAGMVWQQTRAVNIEAAERARSQGAWILGAALDWARLILREDQRSGQQSGQPYDTLREPWAQPLAEARLSSFLAADRDNNADSGLEAFLSGGIEDAQSRLNLRGLIDPAGKVDTTQLAALTQLATLAGAPTDTADRIAAVLTAAFAPPTGTAADDNNPAPIRPQRLGDLAWLGIDEATLARLAPYADLLPAPTPINANTAPREVLAAVIGIDLGAAERLVQARQRGDGFKSLADVQAQVGTTPTVDPARVAIATGHFIIAGRLRLEDRVLEEKSLVQRRDNRVEVLRRERQSFSAAAAAAAAPR